MRFAARITDLHTCPAHGGGPLQGPGSPLVEMGGLKAARATDLATCSGPPDAIVEGAASVLIDGLPAARLGDRTAHGGTITGGLSSVLVGGPTASAPGIGSGMSLDGTPPAVVVAPELCKQFKEGMSKSFPGGKSQEQGATIVRDDNGNVSSFIGKGAGTSGAFEPDRNVPKGQKTVGVFHTHPYDASEGGYTNVSLSGGDAAYLINQGDQMIFAQSGDGQFMYLRTPSTPSNVDFDKLNNDQNARIAQLQTQGKSFDEASRIAAKETAQKYGLAHYEGKDCRLSRVVP